MRSCGGHLLIFGIGAALYAKHIGTAGVKVAYNWTLLGTNGAMRKCFKQDNIENGLSSRILVAEMPDASCILARRPGCPEA